MGLTAFPNGISSFGVPVIGAGQIPTTTGSYWFVSSGAGSDSNDGKTPSSAFATLDYAIGKCTADLGDVIVLMPGHAETISSATSVICDVAGVTIVGLGYGNARPTFSFSAVGSYIPISAANVTIQNIITKPSVDEVVKLFYITGAGVTLDTVDYQSVSTYSTLQFVLTTNAADQLTIKNCYHYQLTAGGSAQKWIQLVGTDSTRIWNNRFNIVAAYANTGSICISGSTAVIDCDVRYNDIVWGGATITKIIEMVTTSTGIIAHNYCLGGAAVLLAAAITGDKCMITDNYVTNTVGTASGALAPAVDTVT